MKTKMKKFRITDFDKFLLGALAVLLIFHYIKFIPHRLDDSLLAFFASIAALPVIFSAGRSIKNKKINVDLLAATALIVSMLNQEWASAVFINLMLVSARLLASYTDQKSRSAIKSLLKLKPHKVKIKTGEKIAEVAVSRIKKGDVIVIELGDRIPVDGIVIEGKAMIDQSSLTGESMPVFKKEDDKILSSTLNVSGSIIIRAEKVGKDTTFEKIIRLVQESQQNKIGIQTLADKFSTFYIAATFIAAILIYLFSGSLILVLSILLVTCADDIAVAIPMAFSAAIGAAARRGIIIKGGAYLEALTKVKNLILDKTGTITKGQLKVAKIIPFAKFSQEEVLRLSAAAEFFSGHPIAKAIVRNANEKNLDFEKPEKFSETSGEGSRAIYDNKIIACGKREFLEKQGMKPNALQLKIFEDTIRKEAGSILFVGFGKEIVGLIILEDEIRPEVENSIAKLKLLGVKNIIMLTGDNLKTAEKVAQKIGVQEFHANLLPEDKLKFIKKYLGLKSKTAMVGDGINDAASLAIADVGIAMGAIGTDAAIEAADIALMKDNFSEIPQAFEIGFDVAKISRQNFIIWGTINALGLVLVFCRIIGPEGAAAYNFITDFFPIINSLRLFTYRFKKT